MNILDKIVARKREEVAAAQAQTPLKLLQYYRHYDQKVPSFKAALLAQGATGIIAEFKRRSPSKGAIHAGAQVADIVPAYQKAGASALSILTDRDFFGGSDEDLAQGRDLSQLPIIRKEFIIDSYQIYEAKAMGASAILLIGAILTKAETLSFAKLANELGMEVLFEIHAEQEMEQLNDYIQLVGINNRNLKTFEVDLEQSMRLAAQLPSSIVPIAESGISSPNDYLTLKAAGFKGFLMGEYFMKNENPGTACIEFVKTIRSKAE